MDGDGKLVPSKSNGALSPETAISPRSSKNSFAFTSSGEVTPTYAASGRHSRSKSMSQLSPDTYSTGDVRRMRERLLRTTSHVETWAIKKFSRSQKMTLACLALVDFMSFCSMSVMAPFFPKEAAEKQLSDTLSGFIFSFYALVMFVTSPIFGKTLPLIGAKKLFLSGLILAGVTNILFGMLEYVQDYTTFTTLCIVIRGFEALGASAFSTASYVFVVNSFPHNIASVLGILETFIGLGMSAGPAIGGILYSLGGFDLPFVVLGTAILLTIPINYLYLPNVEEEDCSGPSKNASVFGLIRVPAIFITGIVVIVIASTWAFLDPTLEPHLRTFDLSPEKIGLVFLLFSGLYGISSPAWGWLADRVNQHWSMMVIGLLFCTLGLLLLGPCPFLPFLTSALWLDLVALSILGISVALALLPTFPLVLRSALEGGCGDTLSTYSVVAGVWSCMFSLGEVIGPSLGGFLLENYGFPIGTTVIASMTFTSAVVTLIYFTSKSVRCRSETASLDSGISESWRNSLSECSDETSPLLLSVVDSAGMRLYTQEKVHNYGMSRRNECQDGQIDYNQVTDVRGTVAITGKGACEV